ncbi:nucleoside triphosphate pyrophosphohydrolase [Halococcus agarilyticus]|uniref:nucleoside triphosphate pyrophosphohydrolase n=1 Tax=Halococcus agarilyticus TaxID=1232219 RepID=UPI000677D439|nr:nucleoside triphosphate pyrophosphohydrolase [Halococcus agarilyticus]
MTDHYDKLVRDQIPEIIERDGETAVTHVADDDEYQRRLCDKLDEETAEFRASGDLEELADVVEVVSAICTSRDIDPDTLKQRRRAKADARGGFADRIVLERVE